MMTESVNPVEPYLRRIRQIAPDLVIEKVTVNTDGLANEVVIVNDALAFRFAKGEYGRKSLQRELQVLKALCGRVPVAVPEPFYTSEEAVAYRFLPGEALSSDWLASLEASSQQAIADQLAEFLQAMHAVHSPDLPLTLAPVETQHFHDQHHRIQEKVYPLLLPHQKNWAEQVFAYLDIPGAFVYTPSLIHGDLAPYHLLVDRHSQHLVGVIDFGTAGLGDPASDLGALLQSYGGGFIQRLKQRYPQLVQSLPRARFYAQAIELQWVLLGLETDEQFWFTAHLGGARDFALS
jgi:aminoglycoside 2''-phosphotransferase